MSTERQQLPVATAAQGVCVCECVLGACGQTSSVRNKTFVHFEHVRYALNFNFPNRAKVDTQLPRSVVGEQ